LDVDTAMSPMLVLGCCSKMTRHVAPRSSDCQTPLVANAA
jgi:hypothetical protein